MQNQIATLDLIPVGARAAAVAEAAELEIVATTAAALEGAAPVDGPGRGWRRLVRIALEECDHLIARAIRNQTSLVKQQQPVNQGQKRQAMGRYDDRHFPISENFQALQEFRLAAHVKMRCRLIQEQYLRSSDQDSRKTDCLLLASGQASASFGDRHFVAERMCRRKVLHAGKLGGSKNFFVSCVWSAQCDVVTQLSEEQIRILQDKANSGSQVGGIILAHIDAVDKDASVLRLIKSDSQTSDGGLS